MAPENLSGIRVIVITGEEFQRSQRMKEVIDSVVDPATRDFNFDTIAPEKKKIPIGTLSELILTFPMMAARRVILIRDFDSLDKSIKNQACEVIAKTPESTLVIVEGEKVTLSPKPPKKYLMTESFKKIYDNQLPSWIKGRFLVRNKKVADDAIALLINNVGDNLRELDNEIDKITIAAGDSTMVNEQVVAQVVGVFKRHTVWTLCNAVGLGEFGEAVRILENLMENEKNKETFFIATLVSHIMKIAEYNNLVRKGTPRQEAMKVITESQFLWNLNKMEQQARNFNSRDIRRSLTMLGRTESSLKKSRMDKGLIMDLMIPFILPKSGKTIKT
ncbi:MAG: DNA polymerase III subunit delta [Candidatus Latescibacteria bacterium]|nr:DNA polymerase III subunit delta [Candidatus Latescibacterota bacterium]